MRREGPVPTPQLERARRAPLASRCEPRRRSVRAAAAIVPVRALDGALIARRCFDPGGGGVEGFAASRRCDVDGERERSAPRQLLLLAAQLRLEQLRLLLGATGALRRARRRFLVVEDPERPLKLLLAQRARIRLHFGDDLKRERFVQRSLERPDPALALRVRCAAEQKACSSALLGPLARDGERARRVRDARRAQRARRVGEPDLLAPLRATFRLEDREHPARWVWPRQHGDASRPLLLQRLPQLEQCALRRRPRRGARRGAHASRWVEHHRWWWARSAPRNAHRARFQDGFLSHLHDVSSGQPGLRASRRASSPRCGGRAAARCAVLVERPVPRSPLAPTRAPLRHLQVRWQPSGDQLHKYVTLCRLDSVVDTVEQN